MSVDRISTPQQRPHLSAEISPAARLSSPPPENRPDDPLNGDVFLSTEITRTSGRRSKLNPEAPPYTIPQLRSLAICDDLPTAPDSRCHACHDTSDARAMKRVLPCHVSLYPLPLWSQLNVAGRHLSAVLQRCTGCCVRGPPRLAVPSLSTGHDGVCQA